MRYDIQFRDENSLLAVQSATRDRRTAALPEPATADPVKLRDQQYSLDERRRNDCKVKGPAYLAKFIEKCLSIILQSVTVQKFTPNHVDSGFFAVTPDEIEVKDIPLRPSGRIFLLKTAEAEPKTAEAPYSDRRICGRMFLPTKILTLVPYAAAAEQN